jgi:chloramphenicol-sensitive protein RarD
MKQQERIGILNTGFSYFLWGILPIYWKFLQSVGSDEILANRIFWSFWFMVLLLVVTGKWRNFNATFQQLKQTPRRLIVLMVASVLISINWFIYTWAVNSNQMIEASLGYYINPLISVLLGVFILKETLSKAQIMSFGLAAIGVLIMTVNYGQFPWISFSLAFSFGLYGLAKKVILVDPEIGLTLETMAMTPIAFIYMLYLIIHHEGSLFVSDLPTTLLLMGAGVITSIPLLLFAKGAQKIPLYMVGFLQYIAPTLTLLLGILVYKEPFSPVQFIAFLFIWSALVLVTYSHLRSARRRSRLNNQTKMNA